MDHIAVRKEKCYEDAILKLTDLLDSPTQPLLEGFAFNRCRIIGPAIVHLARHAYLVGCHFEAPAAKSMLWEVPGGNARVGFIEIKDTSFRRCSFEGVGFSGTVEELAAFSEMLES